MPAYPSLSADDLYNIAEFLHLQVELAANRGTYGATYAGVRNQVLGDAAKGEEFFNGAGGCAACHSAYRRSREDRREISPGCRTAVAFPLACHARPAQGEDHHQATGESYDAVIRTLNDFDLSFTDAAGNLSLRAARGCEDRIPGQTRRAPRPAPQILRRRHTQPDRLPGDPQMRLPTAGRPLGRAPSRAGPGHEDPHPLPPAQRRMAHLQRRLLRPPLQLARPDQPVDRGPAQDRMDVPHHQRRPAARRGRPDHQVHPADGQRHPLLHDPGSHLRPQRAHRRAALAVQLRRQGRPPGGPARRRHVPRLALLRKPGRLVHLAQRQGRQGAVAQEDRRREAAILHHHGAR